MRKFKLIKEYIGSPKLGTIAKYTGDLFDKDNDLLPSVVKDKHFFNFWEEIIKIKKDYKILEFRNNEFCQDWKDVFNENNHIIISVKRLSDSKVFTIGDIVQDSLTDEMTNFKQQIITHFYYGEKIICQAESGTTMPLNTIRQFNKEYEILSFIRNSSSAKNCIKIKNKKGKFEWDLTTTLDDEQRLLGSNGWNIHSIKRLSDGEIFTINDRLDTGKKQLTLDKIYIKDNILLFEVFQHFGTINLENLVKYKQPLFTTEDNIDIFEEGVKVFTVDRTFNQSIDKIKICEPFNKEYPLEHWYKGTKIFSTKQAADKYILMNKPCLSLNDIFQYKKKYAQNSMLWEVLEKLTKTKLC